MNILSYIHVHRLPNPTGVGRVIDQLLNCHVKNFDHRHRMLIEADAYDRVYNQLNDSWRQMPYIPLPRNGSFQQAKWVYFNRPPAEDYWADVDMVYCPAESYVPTRKAGLVCTIHDVAGFEPDLYPDCLARKWQNWKWSRLFNRIGRHADAVVTVSAFSASRIAEFFPALENKLHVVHNAPHQLFGLPYSAELDQEVDILSGGDPYILLPGGLSLRKNAALALKVIPLLAEKLPGVKLIVAGSNNAVYTNQLSAGQNDHVVLAGYVSDELLNALYQRASAVWFPSRYEGFGMPVIEAMVAGAPVVASHAASIPEVTADAALLCGVDDVQAHVDALCSIIESDLTRNELCTKSRSRAKYFTWESSAQDLEIVFKSL